MIYYLLIINLVVKFEFENEHYEVILDHKASLRIHRSRKNYMWNSCF